jgi:hypothetical protein
MFSSPGERRPLLRSDEVFAHDLLQARAFQSVLVCARTVCDRIDSALSDELMEAVTRSAKALGMQPPSPGGDEITRPQSLDVSALTNVGPKRLLAVTWASTRDIIRAAR